jgi:hypothetical protein
MKLLTYKGKFGNLIDRRADLVAILVTLQQMENTNTDEIIATDSQASMYMIHKHPFTNHISMPNADTKNFCKLLLQYCSEEPKRIIILHS